MARSFGLSDELSAYVVDHSTPADVVRQSLIEATAALGRASGMQIGPEQGEFLSILVSLIQPRLAVEVGTFTGYSALSIASALPADGRLLCCDVSEEWTAIARDHWAEAGVADRIDLAIAPAIETLNGLDESTVIDFAFIDADKGGYVDYYEAVLARLAPDGLICVDNTLWSGAVVDGSDTTDNTVALRRFNDHVAADARTRQVMVSIGDGVTMIRHA